jgi:hypothetical protein
MDRKFDDLQASELFCPKCREPRPVRGRLLLFLPQGELHDYTCPVCGEPLGTRETKSERIPPGTQR